MSCLLKLRKSEKGQALVEFALVLPILLLLILGMIEYGWALNGKITLTNAVREGARLAAINHKESEAEQLVKEVAEELGLTGVNPHADVNDVAKKAMVEASVDIKPIVGLFINDGNPLTVTARAEMRLE